MNSSNILSVCLINFGVLFYCIESLYLGLISPIEVVEEIGCHDTELRLTCGSLDSKLAILEATFTPNCTEDECLRFDMRRLVRTFASQEVEESLNAEKKAGQKFLETLRQSHTNEEDIDIDVLEDTDSIDEKSNYHNKEQKKKRTSLRLVLEKLIIRYLRRISPEDELDGERFSRSKRNIPLENIETEEDDVVRSQSLGSNCTEQKRHISSLNRLDLDRSYNNQSDNEYNIRRALNNRCSGKNHCSFIFTVDHPFAKVWEGGIVRVKYICMDDFRINRYCGEHLTIGYEIDPNIQILDSGKGEPLAEPRIQTRETSLHSLKILKADKIIAADSFRNLSTGFSETRKVKVAEHQEDLPGVPRNRIYSQDFRVLKILPSNINDFNDIETIGDEIYFRKDEISTEQNNIKEQNLFANKSETNISNEDKELKQKSDNSSNLENVTLTIREGGQYIMVHPSLNDTLNSIPSNLSVYKSTYDANSTTSKDILEEFSFSTSHQEKDIFEIMTTTQIANTGDYTQPDVDDSNNYINTRHSAITHEDPSKRIESPSITYNSIQRTSFRSVLLHGFAMTPGYPKFYIGEFDCFWNIVAPDGIRIRISILDNSLRFDDVCKDLLLIEDSGINKTLFNSCTEIVQPIAIISISNLIKITVRTTSRFAYPKRGVLLHYTADDCVNLPLPSNVKLVDRKANSAFYECQPSFLFPDSGLSTRVLTCNTIKVWDKLLPNCIEQEHFPRSPVPSEEKLTLLSSIPDLSKVTNIMPSQNDADMIFDIIIPSVLIAGLFIINGGVFAIIMKYRKRITYLFEVVF